MDEKKMLEEIKARCENWRLCYMDRPSYQVSSLYHLMKYLEKYSLQYEPPPARPTATEPGRKLKNPADADLLNNVWKDLDKNNDRLLVGVRFIRMGIPMTDVKRIISIYTFAGRNYAKEVKTFKRKRLPVSPDDYQHIENQALLYFARALSKAEP